MVTEKRREYEREWKRNNRDKVNAWNRAHRKQKAEYDKIYNEKNREKKGIQSAIWYLENKDKAIDMAKKWRRNNIEKCRASSRAYKNNNPIKRKAHWTVKHWVDRGDLIIEPCRKCGKVITEAHHEDYSKPLEVIWLCRKHHKELHRGYTIEQLREKIARISQ